MALPKYFEPITDFRGYSASDIERVYNKLIKTANERIKVSTKAKNIEHASAYKNIVAPLQGASYVKESKQGATIFKRLPKGASKAQRAQALATVQRFLSSRTSTVTGVRELMEERRAMIKADAPNISNETADAILKWMGSEEGKNARINFDSGLTKQAITKTAAARGAKTVSEISKIWKEHLQSRETLADWIKSIDSDAMEF